MRQFLKRRFFARRLLALLVTGCVLMSFLSGCAGGERLEPTALSFSQVEYERPDGQAVLASMIGLGGLGDFVYRGTSSNNNTLILLGAIPAAILAVLFGLVIDLLQKRVTPRGLRKEAGK